MSLSARFAPSVYIYVYVYFLNFGLTLRLAVDGHEGGGHHVRTTLTGVTVGVDVSGSEKIWRTFQAIGDIAFAYAYSTVLIEIQASIIALYLYIYIYIT